MRLAFHHLSFTHEGATAPLVEDLTVQFPPGWTGIVGANGTGKTTLLRLVAGELEATGGSVVRQGDVIVCEQRTDDAPTSFPAFLQANDAETCRLRGVLRIAHDWHARWETLSHGERKRAQIGTALWQHPQVLLLDEPTNHIDADARQLLLQALREFSGIGLLVSHDRELLDALGIQCLFLDPPQGILRAGTYSEAMAQARQDDDSLRHQRQTAQREVGRLSREQQRRLVDAGGADRQRSKKHLARHDTDGRAAIDLARVTGKDGQAGRRARQMLGRVQQAQDHLAGLAGKKAYALNFWLPESRSPRQHLFTVSAGTVELGAGRTVHLPELTMGRDDRIAITGANGTGKSTLLRHLLQRLNVPETHVIYLPQEIDRAQAEQIMADVQQLPPKELGLVMTVVSSLGSRPERLLESWDASPGEIRKVLLALGVVRTPHLIIMDEPTNHLDLPAIELLESALAQCPCGLILVSHDLPFLERLTTREWRIVSDGPHASRVTEVQ